MRIAIKFDDNGKMESYCADSSVTELTEIRPSGDGFAFYETDLPFEDIDYFKFENGEIMIDEASKTALQTARAKVLRHSELKTELEKVLEDVEQEALGIVRDDYAEKKARAAEIINELRALEGKEPRRREE